MVFKFSSRSKVINWLFILWRMLLVIFKNEVFVLWFGWYVDCDVGNRLLVNRICSCLVIVVFIGVEIYIKLFIGL